jgi:hypothetical protein
MQSLIFKRGGSMAMRASQNMITTATQFSFATGPLDDKTKGDEKVFFNKEDQKVLNALLKKMQNQAKQQAAELPAQTCESLNKLLKSHKINPEENKEFVDALLDWKKKF